MTVRRHIEEPIQYSFMKHIDFHSGPIVTGLSRSLIGIALFFVGSITMSGAVHFASGFRVGEVSQNSAIVSIAPV